MRAHLESVAADAGTSFRFLHRRAPQLGYNPHHHHLYELIIHRDGQGAVFVGERIAAFSGPCAFLIAPGQAHTMHWQPAPGRTEHECLVLQVVPDTVAHLLDLPEGLSLAPLITAAPRGIAVVGSPALALWDLLADFPTQAPLKKIACLVEVFAVLAAANPRPLAAARRQRATTSVAKVQAWILAHLDDETSLATLGDIANMHPRALARAFRRDTGHSVVEYLHLLRVGRACELLADPDRPVVACCFAAGFGNLAHFNRIFRRVTGRSPSQYRRLLANR